MKNRALLRRDRVTSRFSRALRSQVGRGRPLTINQIAMLAPVEARALRTYMVGERMMPADVLLRLMAALPPRFAAEVLRGTGWRPVADDGAVPSDIHLAAMTGEALNCLLKALDRGRSTITQRERDALRPIFTELAACAAGWAEQGRAD